MNELKEMEMAELVELKNEWYELWVQHKCPDFRENALAVAGEITRRELEEEAKEVVINVHFQPGGYRWSVDIDNGESIQTGLSKVTAMKLARKLKRNFENARINEMKLSKDQRNQNISELHETYVYDRTM